MKLRHISQLANIEYTDVLRLPIIENGVYRFAQLCRVRLFSFHPGIHIARVS